MTYGADCTHWNADQHRFCGQPAAFVRLAGDGHSPIDVVCGRHRCEGDRLIPADAQRAEPATFWLTRQGDEPAPRETPRYPTRPRGTRAR